MIHSIPLSSHLIIAINWYNFGFLILYLPLNWLAIKGELVCIISNLCSNCVISLLVLYSPAASAIYYSTLIDSVDHTCPPVSNVTCWLCLTTTPNPPPLSPFSTPMNCRSTPGSLLFCDGLSNYSLHIVFSASKSSRFYYCLLYWSLSFWEVGFLLWGNIFRQLVELPCFQSFVVECVIESADIIGRV